MADQWYYSKQGQRVGPVSEEQLQQLVVSGQLQSNDLVWKQGMTNWISASKAGLCPPAAESAGPPPLTAESGHKFCRTCGASVDEKAVACMSCGLAPTNGNKFCRNCGAETAPAAIVCVKCGVSTRGFVPDRVASSNGKVLPSDPPKDPVMMCILSVLLIGLGQIILGQTAKGIVILVGTILFVVITCGWGAVLAPIIWLISGLDAYKIATKLKQGESVGSWEFF